MATKTRRRSSGRQKWVSPIGRTHEQVLQEEIESDPEFRAEWERREPYRRIARIAILRRTDLELTQQQVARRMGTTKSAVSRIESGRYPTSLRTLKKLAEALEMQLVVGFEQAPEDGAKRPKRQLVAV